MGEGVKSRLSVIRAHAAGSNAAKSHPAGSQMDNGIVDATAAKLTAACDISDMPLVLGKQIEGQRINVIKIR